jgi:hypothetical protein
MDADALCIVCNWYGGLGLALGLGGLGAAAAAAAGAFGGFGGGGFSGRGAGGTWPAPPQRLADPRVAPPLDVRYLQQTSVDPETWAPYWPGVSQRPTNGHVTPYRYDHAADDIGEMWRPLPVEPITGLPIWPKEPVSIFQGTAAIASAGRG